MKRIINQFFVLICIVLFAASCQKAPFVTLNTPRSITFTRDGGTQSITFTCNRDWSVSSSESWIQVSPSSGSAGDGEITVKITCAANTTYDPRSAVVTVKVEELSEAISISQDTGLGLIVSPKTLELTNAEQTIEIEVQKNVQYSVAIDNESAAWIKQGGTKALTTDKVTFTISANTSYDNREGKIVFKQLDGDLTETVTIKQAWKEGLISEKTVYDVPYEGGDVEVNMSSNVDYEVVSGAEWIHYTGTKALSSSTVSLTVDSNNTYTPREGTVTMRKREGNLSTVITIKQAAMIAVGSVTIDKNELFLEIGESAALVATISPSNATLQTVSWASSDENVATVDEAGNVIAVKKGKATISAKAEDKEGTCLVYVNCIPDDEIWYTTIDEQPLGFQTYNWGTMPEVISNVYSDGKVRMRLKNAPTEFTERAFADQYNLKTIILPETVTALGWGAFNECNNLESISLSDNLIVIGANAFGVCENLKEITLPDSVENIAEGAFQGCTSLQKINSKLAEEDGRTIVINGTLVAVAWAGLSSYTVPDGVTRIGNSVFSHFSHMGSRMLKTVVLPNTLKSIGNMAFQEAPITSITIPNSVETIEQSAFLACWDMVSATLPVGLKKLENGVFDLCHSLSSITLPEQLESIGNNAFANTSLSTIDIPETVTSIGSNAFNECTSMKSIIIPRAVTYIGYSAFSGCYALEAICLKPLTPPTLKLDGSYSDPFMNTNCPIYVPSSSLSAYQTADVWREYYYSRIQPWYAQPEAIDLGLSVKWASFNVGAIVPEDYGEYYAWGETKQKASYDWSSYAFGGQDTLTKYTKGDGKEVLDPEDDAAHVIQKGTWRMPTKAEFEELRTKCTWKWTTINNRVGSLITGQNGNSIFLPAGGSKYMSGISSDGYIGYYWTSTLYHSENATTVAWNYYVEENDPRMISSWRYNGMSVRAVTE